MILTNTNQTKATSRNSILFFYFCCCFHVWNRRSRWMIIKQNWVEIKLEQFMKKWSIYSLNASDRSRNILFNSVFVFFKIDNFHQLKIRAFSRDMRQNHLETFQQFAIASHRARQSKKSHMISIYLIIVIEWNQCSSKLRKWQKSTHFHNDSDQNFHDYISNDAFFKTQFFALFATIQCDFDHISMRTRSIFHIVNDLNEVHFELYNKSLFVKFTYWMQLLKRCEIVEIANSLRNVEFRNFIRCKSNFE